MTIAIPTVEHQAKGVASLNPAFIYFVERPLENAEDLQKSHELRFEVYCEEMKFLPAADYPERQETDSFDPCSLKFGSFDREGKLVGTVRLVRGGSVYNLPMVQHCGFHPGVHEMLSSLSPVYEVSRLAVHKQYRRRVGDGRYGLSNFDGTRHVPDERRRAYPTVLRLYRIMYHSVKQRRIEHLFASMEVTLFRCLKALRFPFREIGPVSDYFGPVQPFYLNIEELDHELARKQPEVFQYFQFGLPEDRNE